MAVVEVTDATIMPFAGHPQPEYPIGIWKGGGTITGDASGGDATFQIFFSRGTQRFNNQLFSLELLNVASTAASAAAMLVRLVNFGIDPEDGLLIPTQQFAVRMIVTEGGNSAIDPESVNAVKGLLLGRQTTPDSQMNINFIVDNGNGEITGVVAYGYVWGARSSNAPGGPQRPLTGLFR